jgi:hypothetical protein
VLDCAIAYLDHGLLPEAGGVFDQDAALWNDMKLCIALIMDAQERHAPDGDNRPKAAYGRDLLDDLVKGDPLEKGGARMDLWGA